MTARSEVPSSFRSTSARPGSLDLIRRGWVEVLSRRRLISYLVRADLRKSGADTLLGNVWWVIDPLLQMLVYVLLVGVILQRGSKDDFPLFILAAILPWKWFDSTVKTGLGTIVASERLIKQINFPKLVLPIATSGAGVVSFAFGLIPLGAMMVLFFPERLTPWILLIPVIAAVQLVLDTGVTIAVSAVNVFYRDLGNLTRHILRFWFYLSPTLYGIDTVHEIMAHRGELGRLIDWWYRINPFTYLLGGYRDVIYEGKPPDFAGLGLVLVGSLVLVALATLLFKRLEPNFAKIL